MNLSRERRHQIAWYECQGLLPATAVSRIETLAAVVSRIATAVDGVGFSTTSMPSEPGDLREKSDLVRASADKSEQGTLDGVTLPSVAALWEVDERGVPLEIATPLPADLSWVHENDTLQLGEFKPSPESRQAAGRRFVLFAPKDGGVSRRSSFSSSFTLTGIPRTAPVPASRKTRSAWLAVVAGLLFCWSAGCITWTGLQWGRAHQLMQGKDILRKGELELVHAIKRQSATADPVAVNSCLPRLAVSAMNPEEMARTGSTALSAADRVACLHWWSAATQVAHQDRLPSDKTLDLEASTADLNSKLQALQARLKAGESKETLDAEFSAVAASGVSFASCTQEKRPPACPPLPTERSWVSIVFGMFSPDGLSSASAAGAAATASLTSPLLLMIASVLLLAIAAGLGTKNRALGIVINDRNRVSLARCQVVAWSLLILPTIIAFACFNAGVIAAIGSFVGDLPTFPTLPGAVIAALGITIASPMISAVLLTSKETGAPAMQVIRGMTPGTNADVGFFSDPQSPLLHKASAAEASFTDLFLGEEIDNASQVDISRLQMLVITVGLLMTYANMVFAAVGSITLAAFAKATLAIPATTYFTSLPDGGTTFAAMLLVSHGTYLVTKASSSPSQKNNASN